MEKRAPGRGSKKENRMINADGLPLEPPKPSDIEGRPAVGEYKGDDPLLSRLIKEHPERDPARVKLLDLEDENES